MGRHNRRPTLICNEWMDAMAAVTTASARTINYTDAGSGPPVLLIAGLGSTKGSWAQTIERLAPEYRCLAIDNRDAGENASESSGYSIDDMADDAADFLRAMHIERASVIGSSMGGFIALHLALRHPDLVERLVLVGTAAAFGGEVVLPQRADWIDDPLERARLRLPQTMAPGYFEAHPQRLEELATEVQVNNMDFDGYLRQFRAILDTHNVRDRLAEIEQPTLVVHGNADAMVPPAAGEELGRSIPNARLEMLNNIGHVPHRETPDEFARLTREFLAE